MSTRSTIPAGPSPHETLVRRGATLIPSTPSERAALLDDTAWSRRFSWKQLQCLGLYLRRYQLPSGRALFSEGDHDAFLAIVIDGRLDIHKRDSSDQHRTVAELGRGKMVGEMSLLDGAARSATALAATETDLLVLTKQDFDQLAETHPSMAFELTRAIATMIAQLLRQTTGSLVEYLEG